MKQRVDSQRSKLRFVGPLLTSGVALALFSSFNRPLLYDEFIHFMTGPLTFNEVIRVIHETTINLNQGVTGTYLLADWVLLQVFGASDVALRLPSFVLGALFFFFALVFLRHRGMGYVALTVFPIFMLTQELVMHYVGEARPYMPLVTSTVGLLAYYCAPASFRRGKLGLGVAWSATLIGVLFHPYIAVYWPAVLLFGFFYMNGQRSWRDFVRFSNPTLVTTGTIIFFGVASVTWIRGKANADVNPFNFLPGPLPVEILVQNFYTFASPTTSILGAAALMGGVFIATIGTSRGIRWESRGLSRELFPPTMLFLLAFALAMLVSATTIAADFWIFPRQWIASTALAALAIFWAGHVLYRHASSVSRWRGIGSSIVLIAAFALPAAVVVGEQTRNLVAWKTRQIVVYPDDFELKRLLREEETISDSVWMKFAQENIDTGGSVWSDFRPYYLETDWTKYFLTD